ncbi:MAG: tRNA uridine-5-carboxymethylaminomethyl(34) synthesis GTPase MnmE [Porticoccaceae bacterium]
MSRAGFGDGDIIAAVATPPGRGGVGIVRISGPALMPLLDMLGAAGAEPRKACFTRFLDGAGDTIDEGLLLYFPAPHSFTGEDVIELQGHGGPVVMDALLQRTLELGARLANPGEFSQRAFLNGKIDLAQAEAIADLIDASTRQAARSAIRSLQGEFSSRIHQLVEDLIHLRIYIEAAIDFPDEEIDFLSDGKVQEQLDALAASLEETLASARQGLLLSEGMTVVIAGKPNAGKSSLLNALSGSDTAIVTDIAGTTRDVLRQSINLDGMPLHFVDTAGIRESADPVEQEGIRRAWLEIEKADRILFLADATEGTHIGVREIWPAFFERFPERDNVTLVFNKIDRLDQPPVGFGGGDVPKLLISAKTGEGLDVLREHLKDCMGFENTGEGSFMARRRHLDTLHRAKEKLAQAQHQLREARAGELVAEDLRLAQRELGEITGEFTTDDLLGRIFSSFCIGK